MRRSISTLAATALISAACLTGCGSGSSAGSGGANLTMWLWNPPEKAEQQKCVDGFEAKNPGTKVKIEQYGWGDYWNNLTTHMAAGDAPDVITMSSVYFPQYQQQHQLLDLSKTAATKKIGLGDFVGGLGRSWTDPEGKGTYALPKEWSTQGLFYNKDLAKKAGIGDSDMQKLAWNTEDGGTFEKTVAHLTVDRNGVRGDEPGFDKKHVKVYGLGLLDSGGALGQVEWSPYVLSNGWDYSDKNPWGTKFNYSDPAFKSTIEWWRSMITKGYSPTLAQALSAVSTQQPYAAGKYAIVSEGSFNTQIYQSFKGVKTGIAPSPIGPSGKRGTQLNSNAYSAWAGTKNPEKAAKLIAYLESPACQDVIAKAGTVYPALKSSSDLAVKQQKAKGVDVTPFSNYLTDGTAHLAPVADHWSQVVAIMQPVMDSIIGFKSGVSALDSANDKINALYK
ncbi:ABC transporter substrate-binding protein [Streptomyces sp. NPDC088747]|uniref:ABC transporter substrate-binding protein n=1 Tax=Streptomyces sp. NPDC088747 TaxID=3365886 RepID=UPI003830A1FA